MQSLDVNGVVSGGSFGSVSVLGVDKTTKELLIRLPMIAGGYLDGASISIPIPQMGGATLGLETISTGGSALTLRVPLKNLMKGLTTGMAAGRLPNGDALPSLASGELPAIAVPLMPAHGISAELYMSQAIVAVFVNSPIDPYIGVSYPIRDASRTHTYGTFSTVPAKSKTVNGGFFISIAIPDDIARVIDDNI